MPLLWIDPCRREDISQLFWFPSSDICALSESIFLGTLLVLGQTVFLPAPNLQVEVFTPRTSEGLSGDRAFKEVIKSE